MEYKKEYSRYRLFIRANATFTNTNDINKLTKMTSRERVRFALNHKESDRIPVDFGGHRSTGIMVSVYDKLRKYLRIRDGANYVFDMKQMLAIIEEPILKRFGIDVIPLFRTKYEPYPISPYPEKWKNWKIPDGTKVKIADEYTQKRDEKGRLILLDKSSNIVGHMPQGGYYFDYPRSGTNITGAGEIRKPPIKAYIPARQFSDSELGYLQDKVEKLFNNTSYAILGDSGFLGFTEGSFRVSTNLNSIGYTDWMIMMLTEKEYVHEVHHKTADSWIENLKLYYQAVGDKICAVAFADDMGTQAGEMINPDLFKELIAPYYAKVWSWVHDNTNWKVFLHSCGSIYNLIPILIGCGLDILNPVQSSAVNMDLAKLKKEFGCKLVFWGGGCDTQKILPFGNTDQVRHDVKDRINILAPGGGFVFSQIHNVQVGTPLENIVAMFATVKKFGKYEMYGKCSKV